MTIPTLILLLPLLLLLTTPAHTQFSTPIPSMNPCIASYSHGSDTVIFTTPYSLPAVLSIIGSFQNISWSGSPANTVTLNGTDNTVGTARNYAIAGANVTETITLYQKSAQSYDEVHTLAPLTIPSLNLSFYGDYDGTTVVPTCNGKASTFNFTINFCATNATLAAATLHGIHLQDAQTVGVFLGGQNFTTCDAIAAGTPSGTAAATPTQTVVAAGAERARGSVELLAFAGAGLLAVAMAVL